MRAALTVAILLVSATASAADVGEIALVEDTDGTINQSVGLAMNYLPKVSCAFFKTHPENFDAIFVYTTYTLTVGGTPEGWAVKRTAKGIGLDAWADQSVKYCSKTGRLRHAMKLGDLSKWPAGADDFYMAAGDGVYTVPEVIAHEFGHYWLVGASYKDSSGNVVNDIRGATPVSGGSPNYDIHWSYLFNVDSPMFGSFIDDLGGGQFKVYHEHPKYGPLDQYLMGLRDPGDVPPMFWVYDYSMGTTAQFPQKIGASETVTGERRDFTIDDVIRSLGARQPAKDPCHWKAAFVIVHPKGKPPTAAEVAKVDAYRVRFEQYYDWATDNRGSFDTTLDGTGPGTATCPAGPAPDGGYPDAGPHDTGVGTDTGAGTDTGTPDDTGAPGDTGTPDDTGAPEDGGAVVACGQYTSAAGYVGRPCAPSGETCNVTTDYCGPGTVLPCHCDNGVRTCPAIDCVDSGTPGEDTGTVADGATPAGDTGTGGTGGGAQDAGAGSDSPGGCSCAVVGL